MYLSTEIVLNLHLFFFCKLINKLINNIGILLICTKTKM